MKQLFSQYAGLKKEIYILFIGKLVTAMGSFVRPMLTFFLTTKLGLSDGTSTLLIATASVTRSEFLHVLKQIKDFTSGRFFRATIVFILLFSVAYVLFEAHRREMQMRRRF